MLLEREIKNYINANYLPALIKKIPTDNTAAGGIMALALKLDLTKTLRQHNSIGLFVIGDYPRFVKLVEECILEAIADLKVDPPQYGVNISFSISNCPLTRHNLESVEFLSTVFEQENGVLVYLKDAHALRVHQPELYLSSWEELWVGFCSCGEKQLLRKRQSLIEIVKAKAQNIREAVVSETPRCSQCNSKLRLVGIQDRNFLNCQKVRVLASMKDKGRSKEEIFQRGEFEVLLDENNSERFREGDITDMCCYFSAEARVAKVSGREITLKSESGLFMVCSYPPSAMSSNNNLFFSSLLPLSCEYIKCDDPRDEDTICYNYKNLLKTINLVKFPYLSENNLSTLKLVVVNSLFNQLRQVRLHLMVITDEVTLLEQALSVNGVLIKKWPTLYDHSTLVTFLNSCHNCVLLACNPCRKDFEYINNLLNQRLLGSINFTLWVISEPNADLKKEVVVEKFHIVIDLSVQKNFAICRNVYDSMIDQRLESFLEDCNPILLTVPRGRKRAEEEYNYNEETFEGVESNCEEMEREGRTALKLLEKYFIRAREYKTIGLSALESIKNIAEGFAYFRTFLREKGCSAQRQPVNILDAIIAIFIEEESSRNKYSSSNTLFSNEISKLMLNEGDCELSFWDYEVDEEDCLGESRRMINKDDMFKKMVGKLMALLYHHELS